MIGHCWDRREEGNCFWEFLAFCPACQDREALDTDGMLECLAKLSKLQEPGLWCKAETLVAELEGKPGVEKRHFEVVLHP